MIKFKAVPICKKCGYKTMDWTFCRRAPLDSVGPSEFIELKCHRCNYRFKMYTKEHREKEDN